MKLAAAGFACWLAALVAGGASIDRAADFGRDLLRPLVLPFQWRSWQQAGSEGTPAESFRKAQDLMDWLPGWADGYLLFAWRWTAGEGLARDRGAAHVRRLRQALAWLELARADHPEIGIDLLTGASFLVEMAARQDETLAALLPSPDEGFGMSAAEVADALLQAAERAGAGPTVLENRLFKVPDRLAVLLRAGDRDKAVALLDWAISLAPTIRKPALATEWEATLRQLRAAVLGEPGDYRSLDDDPRLRPVLPLLPKKR